jgi:hypothetical protein
MLLVGLIKHHCPFRAVAAAVSGTHIIAHLQFLPFLSERSSVGRFWEISGRNSGRFLSYSEIDPKGGSGSVSNDLRHHLTSHHPAR